MFVTGNDHAVSERCPDVRVHPKPADMAAILLTLAGMAPTEAGHGEARRPCIVPTATDLISASLEYRL